MTVASKMSAAMVIKGMKSKGELVIQLLLSCSTCLTANSELPHSYIFQISFGMWLGLEVWSENVYVQNTNQNKKHQSILVRLKYNLINMSQFALFQPILSYLCFPCFDVRVCEGVLFFCYFVRVVFSKREIETNFLQHKIAFVGSWGITGRN